MSVFTTKPTHFALKLKNTHTHTWNSGQVLSLDEAEKALIFHSSTELSSAGVQSVKLLKPRFPWGLQLQYMRMCAEGTVAAVTVKYGIDKLLTLTKLEL